MSNIVADPGELKMTIHVTRKETGKVEEYTLTNADPVIIPEGETQCQQQSPTA